CTYWGGEAGEDGWGIRLDGDANAYACGTTHSQAFPVTIPCFDPGANGGADGWVTKFGIGRATNMSVPAASGRIGDTVALKAQLTYSVNNSAVTGKQVDFYVDGVSLGSGNTDAAGWASLSWVIDEASGPGARTIMASFAGDASAGPSSGTNTLTVSQAPTSVWVPHRVGTITESVELRAWLRRTTDNAWVVGRTITFKIDGTTVGTGVTAATGRAIYNWVITAGNASRTIGGDFAGDASYLASSGTGTLTCQSWSTKMWGVDRRAKITAYTVFRAWLARLDNTPVVGKTITFSLDGTVLGTDTTSYTGRAQIGYTVQDGAGSGTRTILAQWAGDAGYSASSCTNTLTVDKADAYIWVLPRKVPLGGVANLYAYFRRLKDYQPQTSKTVDFKINGTVVQTVITDGSGIARYSYTTSEPVGVHTIRCEFYGDAIVAAGYGEADLTIY
ncbi:MAG: Ig-like domain repeat protein, partial [Armatimonadetes bacterium]|nr:Ig-like domain repeat protein [Armatimonadota bacterium]